MTIARWMVVLAALAVAGCGSSGSGGGSPTSPGGTQPPPPGGPPPSPGPHMVTGSVVSALDDAAGAANVAFTAADTLVGHSDPGGAFAVGFHTSGTNRTTLTAEGFVTRETGIAAPGSDLRLSLIPSSFDLAAFNQMFRHTQVAGTGAALARWTTPPALVIERRVLQFTSTGATSYTALEETLTDAEVSAIIADMTDGYAILTAGRLGTFESVTTQLTDPGAEVTVSHPGTIVVTRQAGLTGASGFWGYARWATSVGAVTRGFIMLDRNFDSSTNPSLSQYHRSLRMHELGHALGCQHVTGRDSVMNSHARIVPNEFDRQAARIAMLRPPGNRAPDIDPPTNIATTAARTTQPVTWHGAH
ncbi:MAG TPA: hypothetical protein VMN81_00155 [Vicinamibacterales bacterium]|nr:hypothetical protein [Vicinamibacterales bacterium]